MANEKRLIDANALIANGWHLVKTGKSNVFLASMSLADAPTVDAYTEEQVTSIIQQADKMEAKNKELEKELAWLKSCLNCKIRKECPRHCGKVVHDCDHWDYGDSAVDAVEVVHGEWVVCGDGEYVPFMCSACGKTTSWYHAQTANYCPNCGADMRGEEDGEE